MRSSTRGASSIRTTRADRRTPRRAQPSSFPTCSPPRPMAEWSATGPTLGNDAALSSPSAGRGSKKAHTMPRHGYTMFELVLVLAVILIAASLSMPAIDALLASNKVTAARDMVRTQWAEMRARALEEGRPYRFAVTENTGKFRVAPDADAYWSGGGNQDRDEKPPLIFEGELPEGVLFTTSEAAFACTEQAPAPGPEWGLTIAVYLADGVGRDDATIFFGKAGQRAVGLRMRALTGAVTAIEPSRVDEEVQP